MIKFPIVATSSSPVMWNKNVELLVVSVLAIGSFGLRFYVSQFHPYVNWDGTYYINYFRDTAWQSVFHPGYSIFIEIFRIVIHDGVAAARMVSIIAGAALVFPLFFLARNFMNSLLSFLTIFVLILNPLMIRYSAMTLTESLFIFLEVMAFLCYLKRRPILFGVTSGIAYLTRPEALLFFFIIYIYEIFKHRQSQFIGFILLGFLTIALPYIIYLRIQTGEWTMSAKTMNIRVWEKNWRLNVAHESSDAPVYALSERLQSGWHNYLDRSIEYISHMFRYAGIPMMILGIIGILFERNILFAGMAMLIVLPFFGLDTSERFILPYIPFFAMFAFMFIGKFKKVWVPVITAFVIIISYTPTVSYASVPDQGITEFCTAGIAMKSLTQQGDIFVDRKPFTAFYAGGNYIPMPNDPVDSILEFCHRVQAKYLVVSARVVRVYRPQLNFLLYSDTVLNRLHLTTAYVAGLDSGYGIRVIKLTP